VLSSDLLAALRVAILGLAGAGHACAAAAPQRAPPSVPYAAVSAPSASELPKATRPEPLPANGNSAPLDAAPRAALQALKDVESVIDIAGAMVRTPAGPVRARLASWLSEHGHERAQVLRSLAGAESVELRDALVAVSDSVDVLERTVSAEQIGERDVAAARPTVERAFALFRPTSAPPSPTFGWLTPEAIQFIVRASFDRFRKCYEDGLRRNGRLSGRVQTKFVIERDGRVSSVSDQGSTLADPEVLRCVDAGFADLRFGPPRAGMVTVVYPIQFNPGD
jgi:hypothetical protein